MAVGLIFVVVQLLSCVQFFVTPWTTAPQASLSFPISQRVLRLMSFKLIMPSTILSSVVPFSSCPQCFPVSGSFPMRWLFASGGQSIGASATPSVLPMNIRMIFFRTDLFNLFCCPKDSQEYSPVPHFESIDSLALSLFYGPTLISIQLEKP